MSRAVGRRAPRHRRRRRLEREPRQAPGDARLVEGWARVEALNAEHGFAQQVAGANARRYAAAGAIGGIVSTGGSPPDWLAAGRTFQRLWLTATALGLALQPLTGICFLHAAIAAGDEHRLRAEHVELVEQAYGETAARLSGAEVAVVFRVGRGEEPSARSSRLSLEALLELDPA